METIKKLIEDEKNGKINTTSEVLAGRIAQDIQRKGLVPGDKYLIARDAARMFEVSVVTAHRAMKILADREILVRQPKAGTYVGPGFKFESSSAPSILRVVHIMMAADYHRTSNLSDKVFLEGVSRVLPRAAVQIHFVPEYDPLGYTEHIVRQIKASGAKEGMIFIRSSKQVQQYLEQQEVLAAVFGSLYPSVHNLPSLDVDQEQLGARMAVHMLTQPYRKFAVLMHHEWRQGDNVMLNAITNKLGEANIGLNDLDIYSIPFERSIVDAEMRELLGKIKEPTGIFCREDCYAESLLEAMEDYHFTLGKDIGIVSGGHTRRGQKRSYPYTEPELDIQSQVSRLVTMLCELAAGQKPDPMSVKVPVVIREP